MGGTNAQEGRVFVVGQNDTTAYLESVLGDHPKLIKSIEAAYPVGQDGLNTPYDQIAQFFTEFNFQCSQALWANATASVGIPTWRYYFNASFINTQGYPDLGVYHSSEIPMVYTTFLPENTTTQEYALSTAMRGVWARFAKNPIGGPGTYLTTLTILFGSKANTATATLPLCLLLHFELGNFSCEASGDNRPFSLCQMRLPPRLDPPFLSFSSLWRKDLLTIMIF